ncbi:MAG: S-layer homology domain-containing protein [Agathobaculum desmolans]|uniref:S-layer homology domain-containing protein n=1 Tax=Agathobaculum desmolans TaxID=39484 RepID=UPI003992BEE0
MKNLKKVLALVLAFACAFTMFAGAAFTDDADIKTADAVDTLVALGVIDGYADGSFKPDATVTRAEMAKMIFTMLNGGNDDASAYETLPTSFKDVNSHWAKGYIKYLQNSGIIAGKSVTAFAPDATVTGVEAAKMMLVAAGYTADKAGLEGAAWVANTMRYANANSLFADVTCSISTALPRQFAAQILYNALDMENVVYSKDIEGFKPATDVMEDKTIGGKYMDLVTYEGVLTACGEFGNAGKDKIAMDKIEKVNGDATVPDDNGDYPTDSWDYAKDVTDLVGQYVKVQTGKNDKVYGVFAVDAENTVVTAAFSDVKLVSASTAKVDGKVKVNGTEYKFADGATITGITEDFNGLKKDAYNSADEITFISNDGDSKFDLAIVNPMTAFGKVTYVDSKKVNITGVTGAFEDDDIIPEGLAKGDYVAVYEDLFTGNDKLVKADKVTGKVTAIKGNVSDVKIDGNWFKLGNTTANTPFKNAVIAKGNSNATGTGDTLTIYSVNGVAYQTDKESGGSTDTAFVIRKTNSIDADGNVQMRVLFADGSEKTIVAKDTTHLQNDINSGDLVTYDMEGSAYELTKVTGADKDHMAGGDKVVSHATDGKFVKADKKVTIDGKSYRVSSDAVVYIQYQETGSNDVKYRTMTGAELNNLGGDFAAKRAALPLSTTV